jgi:methyl-accepting chemotaxis protein
VAEASAAGPSEQQSSASEQISKIVEAISTVTREIASGTQQSAGVAKDLNRLTENRPQLQIRFNLSGEDHSQAGSAPQGDTQRREQKGSLKVRANGKLVHA